MHWFDRISQRVAESEAAEVPDRATTRRSVLKGATLAAMTLPFVPEAVTQASAVGAAGPVAGGTTDLPLERLPLESINEFCGKCLDRAYNLHNEVLNDVCASAGAKAKRQLLKPKSPGKTPAAKKISPAGAAKKLACQANVMRSLNKELNGCRKHFCEGDSEPPTPPPPGAEASVPTCPPGTALCSQTLCCYGGDACCVCNGDFICCAGVIGCTCC